LTYRVEKIRNLKINHLGFPKRKILLNILV